MSKSVRRGGYDQRQQSQYYHGIGLTRLDMVLEQYGLEF